MTISCEIWTPRGFIDLLAVEPRQVHLDVVAAALSKITRFGGHTDTFYSVAEHSVHCAYVGLKDSFEVARACLMHDAAEAYIGDMVRPLKRVVPAFGSIEERIMNAVIERFNLPTSLDVWEKVRRIDDEVLAAERIALLPGSPDWGLPTPAEVTIAPWSPPGAFRQFLHTAAMLEVV